MRSSARTAGIPGYGYDQFMKKVTRALHRAGVPLIAGTDAMGLPLVAPGISLHRELELLVESGLTPYEAIRAATVAPAVFLPRTMSSARSASESEPTCCSLKVTRFRVSLI